MDSVGDEDEGAEAEAALTDSANGILTGIVEVTERKYRVVSLALHCIGFSKYVTNTGN